jgi:hypothetical protein
MLGEGSTTDKPRPWQSDGVEWMGRKYRTAHSPRADAVATGACWKTWAIFCHGPAEQKRVRELPSQSRELLKQMPAV